MESAIYQGQVVHNRLIPKKHHFSYSIFLLWIKLDELADIEKNVSWFSTSKWAPIRFKRTDYLGSPDTPLQQSVLEKMSSLAGTELHGSVFLLSPLRTLGWYFSPVNFYYLQQENGHFSYLLAEVSNTPWNERHCYLVDLNEQQDSQKVFHVSPFNPMDMTYKWKISQPMQQLRLTLSCHQQSKHFVAALDLCKEPLNSSTLKRVVMNIPSMTIKTVVGIYWQALKLFVKRVPFYGHPAQGKK
jgi:uncharacterized protein